jgi:hypothetical protein
MDEQIFNVEKLDFKSRIQKDIGIRVFVFIFFVSIILINTKNYGFGIVQILFALFFFLIVFLPSFLESINYIYEVKITPTEVKIKGNKFDKVWEKKFNIKTVNIKIIERRSKTNVKVGYFIDLLTDENRYRINKLLNWNNFTLYELFKNFKVAKGEKIIIDEKPLFDGIEEKAKENFEWKY